MDYITYALSRENKEIVDKLSEDIADLKENGIGNGSTISEDLSEALRTYFTNVQILIPQLVFNTENHVAETVIQNAKEVINALGSIGNGSDEPDVPVEPSGIIWSETPTFTIDVNTGVVVEGNDYVSEPISIEGGYVYEIKQPTGGTYLRCSMYDANGNYKYCRYLGTEADSTLYIDVLDSDYIRLSVYPNSPDELDLSTVVPVKTDRLWSVEKYFIDSSTGVITLNERNNYITLQKIPVEGGATYKLSTSGTHQWLSWYEYTTDGVYIGIKGNTKDPKELEATVDEFATYVILTVHGGETPCDNYITFVKTADATGTVEPVDTIWREGKYIVNLNYGTFTETNESISDYLTEKISVEGGATYKLRTLGTHQWLKWLEYSEDGSYLGYKGNLESPKELEAAVHTNATHVILAMSFGENNVSDYATFAKTADAPEEPITPTIIWSETPTCNIDNSGEVTSGDVYVSNMFELEDGVVYAIKRPNNGSWARFAKYDSNGTFLYREEHESRTLYVEGYDGAKIRLGIYPNNNAFDPSTFKPEPIDRLWSVTSKYIADLNTGVISNSATNVDYITVRKIPVIGGSTYRFSSSGNYYYKKIYAYKEDGTFLGYFGNAENFDAVEATLSEDTAYVMLSAWHSNTTLDSDDIMNFSIVSTEEPTSLVYELAEPVTLNGTSDFIDTGVKLYDEDKDFEIMLEFEEDATYSEVNATVLHCMRESNPWPGLTLHHVSGNNPTLIIVGSSRNDIVIPDSGVTRLAIAKVGNYYCVKLMHDGLTEPQLLAEFNIGYVKVDNSLLIGAYQDANGNKGRFWNGNISQCKIYVGDLPSDEETSTFLMGEEKPIEPQSGITQNGSILSIVSGITATQSGSVLTIS